MSNSTCKNVSEVLMFDVLPLVTDTDYRMMLILSPCPYYPVYCCIVPHTLSDRFSPNVNPMALLFPPSPTAAVDPVGMNVEIDSSPYCIDSLQLDTASNCSSTPEYKPSDFIDLMDSTTEFTGPVAMETGGCWSMSPVERPKMFPHKLY